MLFEIFLRTLRSDLNHLYDPSHLRKSRLIDYFGLRDHFDAAFRLQKILVDEIEKLKNPAYTDKPVSDITYELLYKRYVLQIPQMELALQMNLSVRQLRREQAIAIDFLATHLIEEQRNATRKIPLVVDENVEIFDQSSDLGWLSEETKQANCDPNPLFVEVVDLIQPLLDQYKIQLNIDIQGPLPLVAVHPVALKQAILTILVSTIRTNSGSDFLISAKGEEKVEIVISCATDNSNVDFDGKKQDHSSRKIITDLLSPFKVTEKLTTGDFVWNFVLTLPVANLLPVLVIDDNADFFQLLQQYVAGSRYKIHGIGNPENLLTEIAQYKPAIIILDIMMPNTDGWELLKLIHSDPHSKNVPVIISTILPHLELAMALGANDFIQKPISHEDFLAALDRQKIHLLPGDS